MLSLPGPRVRSRLRELRSCRLCSAAKKNPQRCERTDPELRAQSFPEAARFHDEKRRNAVGKGCVACRGGQQGHAHDHVVLPPSPGPSSPCCPQEVVRRGQMIGSKGRLCRQILLVGFLPGEAGRIQARCLIKNKSVPRPRTFLWLSLMLAGQELSLLEPQGP